MTPRTKEQPVADGATGRRGEQRPEYRPAAFRRYVAGVRGHAIRSAAQARRRLLLLVPLAAAAVVVYVFRRELFGPGDVGKMVVAAVMLVIGWALATNLGRALEPPLVRKVDPGAAGVGRFVVRLVVLIGIAVLSLRLAGLNPTALAAGATVTGIILGLAAQQTIGNVFAGVVLLSSRPFQVGDRVRFNGFGMDVEGTVASHGLLYVTMADGDDLVLVPNNTALTMSVRPLRQPSAVDMSARFPLGVDPEAVESRVAESVSTPTKAAPQVSLEEFDGDNVVVRIKATPEDDRDGGKLARQVLGAVAELGEDEAEVAARGSDAGNGGTAVRPR